MKKNIDLMIDGIEPEKVMYDTNNHSLVVLYPAQEEFKIGDKVRLKKSLDLKVGEQYNGRSYSKPMDDVKDAVLTVQYIYPDGVLRCINNIDNDFWNYNKEWLEHIVEDEVKFKRGDILASDNILLIFDEYANKEKNKLHSLWNNFINDNSYWHTKAFKHATDEQIAQLHEDLREEGKKWNAETLQVEDLDISEIVYNLSSACSHLNKPVPDFKSLLLTISNEDFHKYKAQITLQLICEAWNKFDKFEIDWNDIEQEKYAPYRYAGSSDLYAVNSSNWLGFESLIVFKSTERAIQFGNQFKDLLETAIGL